MLTQDWIMRQIETLTLTIAKIVFQKDTTEYAMSQQEEASVLSEADDLYVAMLTLTEEGRFDAAENMLFDCLDTEDSAFLDVANDFYYRLNLLTDQELTTGNFSRQEIQDGLEDVIRQFGIVLP